MLHNALDISQEYTRAVFVASSLLMIVVFRYFVGLRFGCVVTPKNIPSVQSDDHEAS